MHIKQRVAITLKTVEIIVEQIKENFPSDAAFEVAAGLKPKTVDSWKRGNSKGFLKILPKLSKLFGVSTDYLLGNEQKNKPLAEARNLSDIENEILSIFHSLPEDKKQAFITVARSLKSPTNNSKDK